ncbi:ethanolamine utilization protein EutQ [Alkalispirochaeta americana]|uniref:Ethanolamine utilization protein EutQ n=1 Tax=Alkalispirochaeta americana TaxID=159291 RepID=A0A1N6TZD0_9SPIO|nr:cupin domain-containing protein [Alkalispirochaeta americana]SIQ58684.1 ethanolamine utilization protein EutQ [Alkalispirochaeta americana]
MAGKKKLYTEDSIRDLGRSGSCSLLILEPGDIITPLARDLARELSIEVRRRPASSQGDSGEGRPGANQDALAAPPPVAKELSSQRGIKVVNGREVSLPPFAFDIGRPEMDVRCGDVITSADGAPLAAGFLSLQKGSFPWTFHYHEVQYVLEGELHIGTREGTIVGKPGDILYVPHGTAITFGTPSWAKLFYVTYPADWAMPS